jgi:hypothetical protein
MLRDFIYHKISKMRYGFCNQKLLALFQAVRTSIEEMVK